MGIPSNILTNMPHTGLDKISTLFLKGPGMTIRYFSNMQELKTNPEVLLKYRFLFKQS